MKTLNLVYPEKSDIKYQVQKFPDGQQNIVIQDIGLGGNFYNQTTLEEIRKKLLSI